MFFRRKCFDKALLTLKELKEAISKKLAPGDDVGVFYVNKKATSRLLQTPGQELPSPYANDRRLFT